MRITGLFARQRKFMYLDIIEDRPLTAAELVEKKAVEQQVNQLLVEKVKIEKRIAQGRHQEGDADRLRAVYCALWGYDPSKAANDQSVM